MVNILRAQLMVRLRLLLIKRVDLLRSTAHQGRRSTEVVFRRYPDRWRPPRTVLTSGILMRSAPIGDALTGGVLIGGEEGYSFHERWTRVVRKRYPVHSR